MARHHLLAGCIGLLALGGSTAAQAAALQSQPTPRSIALYLGGRKAAGSLTAVMDASGEVYAPALDTVNAAFGSSLSYVPGMEVITGTAADGTPVSLSVAPTRQQGEERHSAFLGDDGQVYVPLHSLARWMNDSFEWSAQDNRVTIMPRLLSVAVVSTPRGPRIQIHGSAPFGFVKVSYYDSPWRVVLDVNGIRCFPGGERSTVPGISQVRWREWPSAGHVRIVAQLTAKLPFSIADSRRPTDYWLDVAGSAGADTGTSAGQTPAGQEFGDGSDPGGARSNGDAGPGGSTNVLPPAPVSVVPTDHSAAADGAAIPGNASRPAAPASISIPVEIRNIVSRKVDPRTTEVSISASGPITCHSSFYDSPSRLVLDIPNAGLRLLSPDLAVDGPGVKDVRTGAFPRGTNNARVVLDLTNRSVFQVLSEQDRSLIRVLVRETEPGVRPMTGSVLAGHTFCIDPGHCGVFHGARGLYGLKEEEVTLDVALRLQQLLNAAGARVIMTRTTPAAPSGGYDGLTADLISRAEMANRGNADLFLSIHCDAMPDGLHGTGHGSQVIYGHDQSIRWARIVYSALTSTLGHGGTGLHFRPGIKVTEYSQMPATLAELGFLDTQDDAVKLVDENFRQQEAEALFHAFEAYYGQTGGGIPGPAMPDIPETPRADSPQPTIVVSGHPDQVATNTHGDLQPGSSVGDSTH